MNDTLTMGDECISIFIPAYNAASYLENLFVRIPASLWPDIRKVYVVNDGSKDSTGVVIESLMKRFRKIEAVAFLSNKGYGTAVKRGLNLCKNDGCRYAVCLHADGQYPPEVIQDFVRHMEIKCIDVLQGSRIASGTALTGGMPLYKYVCGKILTMLENAVFRLRMTDYHSGFLLYSRKALLNLKFESLSSSFDFDLEIIASSRAHGLSVAELPIETRYEDEVSYLNPVTYGLRVLGVLVKYLSGKY